jgi:hypothetical protein
MRDKYYRICGILLLCLLLITTVTAEGTSIILDSDQTTQMSGSALVMCALGLAIFAALIIIKILTMNRGG